jgi:hypothetical protein
VTPLRFGKLIHAALEAWWSTSPETRLAAALEQIPADEHMPVAGRVIQEIDTPGDMAG